MLPLSIVGRSVAGRGAGAGVGVSTAARRLSLAGLGKIPAGRYFCSRRKLNDVCASSGRIDVGVPSILAFEQRC